MFENLSERLSGVFDRLTKQGALSEDDVRTALREVRVALLEADVSLPVARDFVKAVQDKATGQAVTKSVTPGQQVIKIVHDELVHVLEGEDDEPGALKIDNPPAPILMVGLQGGGKTTTTAKLAKRLKEKAGKRVLMASLDVNRPTAMEQLAILGAQIGVDTLPIVKGQKPVDIAKRAKQQATLGGYDVYMLDTAGRLQIDQVLMQEVEDRLPHVGYAPVITLSAKTGARVGKLGPVLDGVFEEYNRRIKTGELNRKLEQWIAAHTPPMAGSKPIKFYYASQTGVRPPTFVFFTNLPSKVPAAYQRYLTNKIRQEFGFFGTPVKIMFRPRKGRK